MAFSTNLQYLRAKSGLTQEAFAEQLGVSRQSVSKWESGASFPEMELLLRLCDLYGVNLDALLRGDLAAEERTDSAGYDAFMNRFSRRIAAAVAAIIAGVGVMLFLSALSLPEPLPAAVPLLILTLAVVVFVASALENAHFRKKHPCIEDFYTEAEREAFRRRSIWYIAGGVGTSLFDVVLLLLAFSIVPEREPYESCAVAGFLLILSAAVGVLVYAGIQDEKYKIWKYNRDNNPSPEAKKRLDLIGTTCGCIMLFATAIYVGRGLSRGYWGPEGVWVFAVGGILCAAVGVVLDPYRGEDD